MAVTGTDGDEDALVVAERFGDDDEAGDVEAGDDGDDAVLAACVVLELAVVGGAVVDRCVVLGFAVGVVTTPTTVGVGVAGGRTWKYVVRVNKKATMSTTVDIRTRWRIAITSRQWAVRCPGRSAG